MLRPSICVRACVALSKAMVGWQGVREHVSADADSTTSSSPLGKATASFHAAVSVASNVAASPHYSAISQMHDPTLAKLAVNLAAAQVGAQKARREGERANEAAATAMDARFDREPEARHAAKGILSKSARGHALHGAASMRLDGETDAFLTYLFSHLQRTREEYDAKIRSWSERMQQADATHHRNVLELSTIVAQTGAAGDAAASELKATLDNERLASAKAMHALRSVLVSELSDVESCWRADVAMRTHDARIAEVEHHEHVVAIQDEHAREVRSLQADLDRACRDRRRLEGLVTTLERDQHVRTAQLSREVATAEGARMISEQQLMQNIQRLHAERSETHRQREDELHQLHTARERVEQSLAAEVARLRNVHEAVLATPHHRDARRMLFYEALKSRESTEPSVSWRGQHETTFDERYALAPTAEQQLHVTDPERLAFADASNTPSPQPRPPAQAANTSPRAPRAKTPPVKLDLTRRPHTTRPIGPEGGSASARRAQQWQMRQVFGQSFGPHVAGSS